MKEKLTSGHLVTSLQSYVEQSQVYVDIIRHKYL